MTNNHDDVHLYSRLCSRIKRDRLNFTNIEDGFQSALSQQDCKHHLYSPRVSCIDSEKQEECHSYNTYQVYVIDKSINHYPT